jgi:transposase
VRDTDLYQALLGLTSPWTVSRVELDVAKQRVDVWAEHPRGERFACPECGTTLAIYDHAEERSWRHLDSCQFMTFLHARPPRVECPTHGVRQARLAWAEPHSRFTLLFERLAVEVLLAAGVTGATRVLRVSWDEAWHLMQRAVKRGLAAKGARVVKRIGVDEKAAGAGQDYVTLVCDYDRGTVEDVQDGRKTESLLAYYDKLSPTQLASIEAIAMDMHHAYLSATLARVPDARDKIVHDLFHVMRDMGRAVDDVRKQEHAQLSRQGDDTLARSKYLWLYGQERIPERSRARFDTLKAADLKTARAWAIKENLREFWRCRTVDEAYEFFERWRTWAARSQLPPIARLAASLNRHLRGLLTYFKHRITNAVSEGLNGKVQAIKKMAYGYRNRENFKTAIYFHCGGLELAPPLPTH